MTAGGTGGELRYRLCNRRRLLRLMPLLRTALIALHVALRVSKPAHQLPDWLQHQVWWALALLPSERRAAPRWPALGRNSIVPPLQTRSDCSARVMARSGSRRPTP